MGTLRRRDFLAGTLVAAGGGLLPSVAAAQQASGKPAPAASRAFRFVHFGDTHVGAPKAGVPGTLGDDGYPKALKAVHAMEDRADFILHSGDIITDAFWATPQSAITQWDIYDKIMAEHCTLPVHYTLGNHDVNFSWGLEDGSAYPGKKLAMDRTGMDKPYYSFDHKGWHIIVLDNNQRGGYNGFTHHIDETQLAWLEADLEKTGSDTPIVISSHAPILTVTCFFCPSNKQHPDGLVIPNDWVHTDVDSLHRVLRKHKNVKLCLSGHFHAVDHVEYLGIHHICGGAVCADYWRKPLPYAPEHEAGFGVVDLFEDGGFEYRYVDYGLVGYQDDPNRERYPWPTE